MPQTITVSDLEAYRGRISNGGVDGVHEVYNELQARGYEYAGWGDGVAKGDATTGLAAIDYLKETALNGSGTNQCRNLTDTEINKIRQDMAEGYVKTLIDIAKGNGGKLNRDVTYDETRRFHEDAFKENGLGLDNWTLKIPLEIIEKEQGRDVAEKLWRDLRDTGGSGLDALLASGKVYLVVQDALNSKDGSVRDAARKWLDRFPQPTDLRRLLDYGSKVTRHLFGRDYSELKQRAPRRPNLGTVKTPRPYTDPLVVDLDGDNIELSRLSGATSVKFDGDGDGVRTATAWVAADDALLVLDRNGNGRIDDGRELFGDQTRLANGQLAADGIAALAELDSNGDGIFSALDARYGDVRLWRDRNQDGISQADELIRLVDAGVASIALNATSPNTGLIDAVLKREGIWTATDGSIHNTGSFDFAQDTYWTAFDAITISEAAKALPNIGGNGYVRDLREAATLNSKLIDLYAAVESA
ncbi:MAG: hypothetical protein EKK49_01285, partial [Rhodocyclaceae bacterium]